MNEKLNEIGIESLDKLREYVESAEAFASEQIPLVLQEMIRWELVSRSIGIFLSICIISTICILARLFYKKIGDGHPDAFVMTSLMCCVCNIVPTFMLLSNIYYFMYVLFAPRLFLLDKFIEVYQGFRC